MLVTITAKVKIKPSKEQSVLLLKTMRAYSNACNHVSAYIFETKNLKQAEQHNALYYSLREQFAL
ncbi:MAG: transposase, partial [Symbiobacteriaceae bacterium]|nr:transposase [Symbiobacteriaceae bacterium]